MAAQTKPRLSWKNLPRECSFILRMYTMMCIFGRIGALYHGRKTRSGTASGPTTGIQPDGSCPLIIMLPFSDWRPGPPEWATEGERTRMGRTLHGLHNGGEYNSSSGFYGFGWWPSPGYLGEAAYTWLASAQLAMDHFNARDASVVPILASLEFQMCNVTFPNATVDDSSYVPSLAFDRMTTSSRSTAVCAVIGPESPESTLATSLITERLNIPQLSYGTIDERISDMNTVMSVARLTTEIHMFIESAMQYIQRPGKQRNYIVLIHDLMQYGEQVEHTIFEIEKTYGLKLVHHHIRHDDPESVLEAIRFVAADGYRTFMIATDQTAFLDSIAKASDELGLINEGYFWTIVDLSLPWAYLKSIQNEVDSSLDKLLRGAAVFRVIEPFQVESEEDRFMKSWRSQDDDFMNRVNAIHPFANDQNRPEHFVAESGFFQANDPSPKSSLIYDSVMLAGISACRVYNDFLLGKGALNTRHRHVMEVLETEFEGASGKVKFEEGENSRLYEGIVFGVYNIWPGGVNETSGKVWYEQTLTSISNGSGWEDIEGMQFKFFNGQPDQPMPLRTVFENNYLPIAMHTFGLVMMSLAVLIAIASAVWIWVQRKKSIVRAAQPVFLYCVCFGSAMLATSLIFISFDESYGWSEDHLSMACTAFPWFFVIGYLIQYCAIFCKFQRIHKLFSMVRQKVTITQVLLPFIVIITLSIIVLIIWTVIDPLVWHREIITEAPLTTYGKCNSSDIAPYIAPLCVLMAVATASTMFIAWKVKDIQSEFSEWNWVFYGIFIHLQMFAIGIPLFIILTDVSRSASHLISSFLIFIFSVTLVVLIIWPKVFLLIQQGRGASMALRGIVDMNNSSTRRMSMIGPSPQ